MTRQRRWAWPVVPLYGAGLAVKDGLRAAGVLKVKKLKWPVVSVGSLSTGGAGKTPLVIALAELLGKAGWQVDVLSRGYGRMGGGVEQVDPDVVDAALRFGDEPVLIAQRTGVPVWVGADRFAAGQAAEGDEAHGAGSIVALQDAAQERQKQIPFGNDKQNKVHLLDDGFQHRGLARAADIVLVTEQDLEDALLPAGNRRESFAALRRADAVVLREEERERIEARARGWMRPDAVIWTVRRAIDIPSVFPGAGNLTRENYGLLAFCAIARPQNFVDTLRTGGVRVVDAIAFPDHHRYTAEDIQQLTQRMRTQAADAFITTEKDAVKLAPQLRAQLEASAPLLVARLHATFADPQAVLRDVEARLQ